MFEVRGEVRHLIFSDASFDPVSKSGVAGIMILAAQDLEQELSALPIELKIVKETSCTRLELEAFIWALESALKIAKCESPDIEMYTDCKTVVDLPLRRKNLECNQFRSRASGLPLSNADLYQKIFELSDAFRPKIIWVKGHTPREKQDSIQKLFSALDKATRSELRRLLNEAAV